MADKLPAAAATGKTIRLELTLVLSIPDEVYDAFMAEVDRLSKPHAVGTSSGRQGACCGLRNSTSSNASRST
jgi:hypothetical protein